MPDYDAAEVRRVLKLRGHNPPERGKLSGANIALYEEIIGADGEYQGGVTAADFAAPGTEDPLPGMDEIELEDSHQSGRKSSSSAADDVVGDQAEELAAERTPRGATAAKGGRARAFLGRDRGGGGRAKRAPRRGARKSREWIPTGPLIERMWGEFAWAMRKAPPIQRVMAAQAPMVGVVMQDTARNTIFDRGLLQPLARVEDKAEAVNAVFGPIFWTGAIMRFGGFDVEPVMQDGHPVITDAGPVMQPVMDPDTGMPAWNDPTRMMIGGLRMSLMSWLRVGQRHAAEIIARAEELDNLGDQADALIAFILSPPTPGQSFKDMQREARQRTGVFLHGEATGGPDYVDGEEPGGGAAAPSPATAGYAPGTVVELARGAHPYPDPAVDPRTLGFTPPDRHVASQVVPRAPMPQA